MPTTTPSAPARPDARTADGSRRDWAIGIDVGGTFTDGVLLRPGAPPVDVKSPTDHRQPAAALRACLTLLAETAGTDLAGLLARTGKFAYGTTQATNLVVERKGARVGFITTRGFRDTLIIAGIGRERIGQDLIASRAAPLVPRHLIYEVRERIDAEGREVAPLHLGDLEHAIERMQAEGVEAVGVCLLWSFRNPAHERAIADALRARSDWFVTASSDVVPLLGEYERSATTALNAVLGPPMRHHLSAVERQLADDGLRAPLLIMQSSGGVAPAAEAARRPVSLVSSGPAGGVLAAKLLADTMGIRDLVCVDMGGTSFDVSLISGGEFAVRDRMQLAGNELFLPAIDVHSIGAGGGSLGWIDHGSRLKVGPQSAGAYPGPACYGRGGARATVTDANLQLGRLNPAGLASGRLPLDAGAAERALATLGAELGFDALATAAGMVAIVDAAMADAIRVQTVRRGIDPAEHVLFTFGGAGALHAAALASELGIKKVVVPALATVLSAYGVAASDILHTQLATEARPLDDPRPIAAGYERLEAQGLRLLEADGTRPGERAFVRTADCRFRGQLHSVSVPVEGGPFDRVAADGLRARFIARYEALFGPGTSSPEAGIEVTTLRVDAIGRTARPSLGGGPARGDGTPHGVRRLWYDGAWHEVPCYRGPLPNGHAFTGPAVVDFPGTTVWVTPDAHARTDEWGSLVLEFGA